MGSYVRAKREYTAATGLQPWIPVNRWVEGTYTVTYDFGAATVDLEGTLAHINRGEDPDDAFGITGATGLTGSGQLTIVDVPLDAIRLNVTAGLLTGKIRIQQNGAGWH